MATTRRALLAIGLATAVVPTFALVATAVPAAPHQIFADMETHSAAWHHLDNACTKAGALFKKPHTTTVAALRDAEAERDAIGEEVHWPAYEKLLATAIAGVPPEAVMPLLRHMSRFELVEHLDFDELRAFLSSLGTAAEKA
jgi:hypothetical protein